MGAVAAEQAASGRYGPIEVFREGRFDPLGGGGSFKVTDAELRSIAASYDGLKAPAPVVIGHPKTDHPAYGWVDSLYVENGVLKANLREVSAEFADTVRSGRYKKVSISVFLPDVSSNPKPGSYYLRHVGFLGAAAPAVPNLKPVEFSEPEQAVTLIQSAEFSAVNSELDQLRREARERELDNLIDEGRILPCMKKKLIEFASELDDKNSISFADGGEATMKKRFMQVLKDLPPAVSYGAVSMADAVNPHAVIERANALDVPEGYSIDPSRMELFEQARAIERERGISFADAIDLATGRR